MKKIFKRTLGFISATILALTTCITPIKASAITYQERSSSMIQFFAGKDTQGEPTEDDIRMFGIYMSNFYEPFKTDMSSMKSCMEAACEKLMGGSIPASSRDYVDALIEGVINNIVEKSIRLSTESTKESPLSFDSMLFTSDVAKNQSDKEIYYILKKDEVSPTETTDSDGGSEEDSNDGSEEDSTGDATEDNPDESNDDSADSGDTSEPPVSTFSAFEMWSFTPTDKDSLDTTGAGYHVKATKLMNDNPSIYCSFALNYCITANIDNFVAFVQSDAVYEDLIVSPFGDLMTSSSYIVIVPGCINPYTWESDGCCLPLVNDLTLKYIEGDFGKKVDKKGKSYSWAEAIFHDKGGQNGTAAVFKIRGLQTTKRIIDKGGTETSEPSNSAIIAYSNQGAWDGEGDFSELAGLKKEDATPYSVALLGVLRDVAITDMSNVQQSIYLFDSELDYENPNFVDIFFDMDGKPGTLAKTINHNEAERTGTDGTNLENEMILSKLNVYWYQFGYDDTGKGDYGYNYNIIEPANSILALKKLEGVNFYPQIFYTYMMTGYNKNLPDLSKDITSTLGSMLNENTGGKDLSEMQETMLKRMMDLTDNGISDTKGNFLNDFLNSFILKAHKSMLGIRSNNIATVSNSGMAYSGFTGHVTTPTLKDFPFTSNIINNYDKIYLVLMSIVIVCVVIMFICHMKTWQQCITLTLIMLVCLAIPQSIVDGAISLSNNISNSLYANRFNYWAMIQHQQELQSVRDAGKQGDLAVTLAQNFNMVQNYYADDGVQLRWMSAKKGDTFDKVFGDSLDDGTVMGSGAFKALFSGYFKQESYSNDPLATYVYRTYSSIAKAAKEEYVLLSSSPNMGSTSVDSNLLEADPGLTAIANGIVDAPTGDYHKPNLSSTAFRTAFLDTDSTSSRIGQRDVNVGNAVGFSIDGDTSTDASLNTFLLYSESPFYYFYNVFMNTTVNGRTPSIDGDAETGEVKGFLKNMLSDEMFKVTNIESPMYGMTKDFLDMEGLFTYVIPYMHSANMIVGDFTSLRGTDYSKYGNKESVSINTFEEIENMWNLYCPWVDAMYETSCLNDSIKVINKRYTIGDAFNPSYYTGTNSEGVQTGRPMAFGEADMQAKGITLGDATTVESKINQVLEDTYIDIRYLANYSAFSDEVLVTAAAMAATFNFNQVFSESGIFKNSVTLYPQGYELKTFSYDAFLRLILLNSTGQSVMAKTDIYTAVIQNTSFITGIILLIVDVLALHVLPTAKLIFIVLAFVLSLLMVFTCFLQGIENAPKTVINSLVLPMLKFLGISMIHAFATALLMGEGLTELVGSKTGALVTNDPTVTLLLLALINGFASVMYIKILLKLIKDGIVWAKETAVAITGLFKSLADTVTSGIRNISAGNITVNADGSISNKGGAGSSRVTTGRMGGKGALATAAALGGLHYMKKGADLPRRFDKKLNHVLGNIEKSNGANIENVQGQEQPRGVKGKLNAMKNNAVGKVKETASKTVSNYKEAASKLGGAVKDNTLVQEVGESIKFRTDKIKSKVSETKIVKGAIKAKEVSGKVVKGGAAVLTGAAAVKLADAASEKLRNAGNDSRFVRGKRAARAEADIRAATGNRSAESIQKDADEAVDTIIKNEEIKERLNKQLADNAKKNAEANAQFADRQLSLNKERELTEAFMDAEAENLAKQEAEVTEGLNKVQAQMQEEAIKAMEERVKNNMDLSKNAMHERSKQFQAEFDKICATELRSKYSAGSDEYKKAKAELSTQLREKYGIYEGKTLADARKNVAKLQRDLDDLKTNGMNADNMEAVQKALGRDFDEYKKQSDAYTDQLASVLDATENLNVRRQETNAEFSRMQESLTREYEVFSAFSADETRRLQRSVNVNIQKLDMSSAEMNKRIQIADGLKDKIATVSAYTTTFKVDSAKFADRVQHNYMGEDRSIK